MAEEKLAVAQARYLSIAILDKVIRLFVGAFTEVDVNVGIRVAAEIEHQRHGVSRTGEGKAVEREPLLAGRHAPPVTRRRARSHRLLDGAARRGAPRR